MRNQPLDQQISFWVKSYFRLSAARRKAIQYMFWLLKENGSIIFKIELLCEYTGWHENAAHKFIRENKDFLFEVKSRFNKWGRQLANEYSLNKYLKQALEWLDIYGYLKSPKARWGYIISSIENSEKVYPRHPQKCTPILKILNPKEEEYSNVRIHPKIDKIKIPLEAKKQASSYPEFAIIGGLEDVLWYRDTGKPIKDPAALLIAQIQRHAGVRPW